MIDEAFRVVVADPPWLFRDSLPGRGRGSVKHYHCLSVPQLMSFNLPVLAPDCVLFMWRVASMQQEALDIVRAWGFVLKTELVWKKRTKTDKRHFGMGRIVRAEHETCLVATRGRIKPRIHNVRSTFEARVGRHSKKPEEFFDIVESLFDGPYVELFARRHRPGWTCLGNEISEEQGATAR